MPDTVLSAKVPCRESGMSNCRIQLGERKRKVGLPGPRNFQEGSHTADTRIFTERAPHEGGGTTWLVLSPVEDVGHLVLGLRSGTQPPGLVLRGQAGGRWEGWKEPEAVTATLCCWPVAGSRWNQKAFPSLPSLPQSPASASYWPDLTVAPGKEVWTTQWENY